jgi:hypothetical protein
MLYLVPTPIGNLKDFTFRAIEVLQSVDFILCEDTRTSSKLLQHYKIHKPLTPYHQHNEHKVLDHLVQQLQAGKNIALITDAGTPGISDPAFLLVRACKAAGESITSIPGATAFVPALVTLKVISASSSTVGFAMVVVTADVIEVFSPTSIVNLFVPNTLTPSTNMSTTTVPELDGYLKLERNAVIFISYSARIVNAGVDAVNIVRSSLKTRSSVFLPTDPVYPIDPL